MYIDVIPNRDSPPAILLRQSVRVKNKIQKKTIANLSHWTPERVEAVRKALRGDFDGLMPNDDPISGLVFGLLYGLKSVADDLGILDALSASRQGKLQTFLVLARVAHQGSRLSSVRWAQQHAVAEVLGLTDFDEDDLYEALDHLAHRQEKIEKALYRSLIARGGSVPVLFLYDVTSSYFEGTENELAKYGYNRDKKKGKKQIVVGLLTDAEGEPISVRVFAGNTSDPDTVEDQIEILKKQFKVEEVVFVGDRGMVKTNGKERLKEQKMRYITALTDPQIRSLLKRNVIQLGLFEEVICEVEVVAPLPKRYILRKNESVVQKEMHRLEDKLTKLAEQVQERNKQVERSVRCQVASGLKRIQGWIVHHRLSKFVFIRVEDGRKIVIEIDEGKKQEEMALSGCYVIETDVPKADLSAQVVHDRYKDLAQVEQDFRTMKTGLLEVRPVFVRKESRTRGHVFVCLLALKLVRELRRRLTPVFATTDSVPHTVTVKDALAALSRLCLLTYTIDGKHLVTRLPRPDEKQKQILEALRVYLPKQKNVDRRTPTQKTV